MESWNKPLVIFCVGVLILFAGCVAPTTPAPTTTPAPKVTAPPAPEAISFKRDVLPFFNQPNVWFKGSQACVACHFATTEASAHMLDMGTYKGVMLGADLGKELLFESGKWKESMLRKRLRNNRMPTYFPFVMDESNRDGPNLVKDPATGKLKVETDAQGELKYGGKINAVGLIAAWVDAGAKEKDAFSYGGVDGLTFEKDVLPFFNQPNVWFKGSQACVACHFATTEASAHMLDMGTYKGVMLGADLGKELLFESGKWKESMLRKRLRNNRMPTYFPFVMDESNRDGPCVEWDGSKYAVVKDAQGELKYTNCKLTAVALIGKWVDQGAKDN